MSAYDFNHNEHTNNSNHLPTPSSGGTQVVRYQVDNDYLSRGFSSTQQPDTSFQLTRPTSKTAMLVRQRRAELEQLHGQLSCFLCKGYLIDATTIDECMDSFCKSCIIKYLRNYNNCPKCGVLIHKTNPLSNLRSDKVLQDIVYKLVPGLYDNEMKRRRDYYRNYYGASSDEDDEEGSSGSLTGRCSNLTGEQYGVISHPKPFYKPTDSIDLSIEPQTKNDSSTIYYDNKRQSIITCFTGNVQQTNILLQNFSQVDSQQFKTYLRCPAKFTALQLKKFIAAKFNIGSDDTIHLLYVNESLKDRYSLIDIAYIYDWRGIEHMRLYYIIERDLSRSGCIQGQQSNSTKVKTRQSVGTSTQVTKRVCIDPHPKFYDDQSNSNNNGNYNGTNNTTNGRTMRPRPIDSTAQSASSNHGNVTTTKQTATQPILRSTYNPANKPVNQEKTYIINSNGKRVQTLEERPQKTVVQSRSTNVARNSSDHHRQLQQHHHHQQQQQHQQQIQQDTRLPKKVTAESSTSTNACAGSIPKININLSSLYQKQNVHVSHDKNVNTYSKPTNDTYNRQQNEIVNNNQATTIRQLVPYYGTGQYPTSCTTTNTGFMGPTQSSLVTLASFTQARSNHVVAVSSSTAATISRNIMNAETTNNCSVMKPNMTGVNSQLIMKQQPISSQPQLAFSFVTERGITIVRRMNNQEETLGSIRSSSGTSINSSMNNVTLPALPAPISNQCTSSSSTSPSSPMRSQATAGGGGGSTSSSSTSTSSNQSSPHGNDIGSSSRHHIKAKPVYKTFVDPTKLKSPNFKKFGYTARH